MTLQAANPHGAYLTIDLDAIASNWRTLLAHGKGADCAAVVKADAYGTGIEQTGPALAKAGCKTFFVAHLGEGERLRAVLPNATIYVLNGFPEQSGPLYKKSNLRPVLGSQDEILEWASFCKAENFAGEAAIHIDTGLNRLGVEPDLFRSLAASLNSKDIGFNPTLVMTHLASSETLDTAQNDQQTKLFDKLAQLTPSIPASLCNSSAVMRDNFTRHALMRPGYALYGGNPTPWTSNPMQPVITLTAPILQVRSINEGERVGYNARWIAKRPTRLAVISAGYADGLMRLPPDTDKPVAEVLIGGTLCPVAGRLSMDLMIIDATDVPPAHLHRGADVTLIGGPLDIDRVGQTAGTIGYLILTSLSRRYQRRYLGGA